MVTLADLAAHGRVQWVYCSACGHEVEVAPLALGLDAMMPIPDVRHHLMCGRCGARGYPVIDARPQLHVRTLAAIRGVEPMMCAGG